jgi:hypothetical protein
MRVVSTFTICALVKFFLKGVFAAWPSVAVVVEVAAAAAATTAAAIAGLIDDRSSVL